MMNFNKILRIAGWFFVLGAFVAMFVIPEHLRPMRTPDESAVPAESADPERSTLSGWDILTLAIIAAESEFDSTATNGDAWGILQIRPIYVDDVNRILGIDKYCHDDAFSVRKSLEMFNIVQGHYNPAHDIDRAIQLHNPTASVAYREKVLRNFRQLVKITEISNQL